MPTYYDKEKEYFQQCSQTATKTQNEEQASKNDQDYGRISQHWA